MDARSKNRRGPLLWLKERTRSFWIAVVLGLPLFYVASFGPACWYTSRPLLNGSMTHHAELIAYWPLGTIVDAGMTPAWLRWWMELGVPEDHALCITVDYAGSTTIGWQVRRSP